MPEIGLSSTTCNLNGRVREFLGTASKIMAYSHHRGAGSPPSPSGPLFLFKHDAAGMPAQDPNSRYCWRYCPRHFGGLGRYVPPYILLWQGVSSWGSKVILALTIYILQKTRVSWENTDIVSKAGEVRRGNIHARDTTPYLKTDKTTPTKWGLSMPIILYKARL